MKIMLKDKKLEKDIVKDIVTLLSRLDIDNQYLCIAGIPGPALELRSGTIPKENKDIKKLNDELLQKLGLDKLVLEEYIMRLNKCYNLYSMVKSIEKIMPEDTQQTFFEDFAVAMEQKILGGGNWHNNPTNDRKSIFIVNGKNIEILYPNDLVTIGLIMEIFADCTYDVTSEIEQVDIIYDLGANIGLSSAYFNAINPNCRFICVEPFKPNQVYLEQNIRLNRINAEIIPMAISDSNSDSVKIFYSDQSHALPSLSTLQELECEVNTISLEKIVREKNYGMKIDIEGSEIYLSKNVEQISKAKFIVGELHYSKNEEKNKKVDEFFSVIRENFEVEMSRPILYFVGDEVELCLCYKTNTRK